MPILTRTFRPTLPGAVARSNLPSGIGLNPEGDLKPYGGGGGYGTGQGYGTGLGYGTGQSPTTPVAPVAGDRAATPSASAPAARPRVAALQRSIPRSGGPNAGGTITRNGVATVYAPTPAADRSPNRPNLGGTMTRNLGDGLKATTVVPPSPAAIRPQMTPALPATMPAAIQPALDSPGAPVISPTTEAAPQTESANPLSGDGNAQPEDTTDAIDPGSALGLNRRGAQTPKGSDALPADPNTGGSGLYARKFNNPKSANLYSSYVKKLFGGAA